MHMKVLLARSLSFRETACCLDLSDFNAPITGDVPELLDEGPATDAVEEISLSACPRSLDI